MKKNYFSEEEFNRCTPSCSLSQMDAQFLDELITARSIANVPFVLLSAYRSPDHDRSRGRSGSGYHTSGRAVDVRCTDGESRLAILEGCFATGLSVGVYPTFIHIDNRRKPIVFVGK